MVVAEIVTFLRTVKADLRTDRNRTRTEFRSQMFHSRSLIEHYWYNLSIPPCPVSKHLISTRYKPTIMFEHFSLPNHYKIHTFHSLTRFLPKLNFTFKTWFYSHWLSLALVHQCLLHGQARLKIGIFFSNSKRWAVERHAELLSVDGFWLNVLYFSVPLIFAGLSYVSGCWKW